MARPFPREPQYETRHARLSEQFGYDYAVKLFGQKAVDSIPLLQAGPNKGKPRGFVHWKKAMSAGYSRSYSTPVKEGTLVRAWLGEHMGTLESDAMRGHWMGRTQSICGSRSLLFEEGRRAWMALDGHEFGEGD